jgi:hypothetical protein
MSEVENSVEAKKNTALILLSDYHDWVGDCSKEELKVLKQRLDDIQDLIGIIIEQMLEDLQDEMEELAELADLELVAA